MNCEKTQSLSIDYLNKEVDNNIKEEIDLHLKSCEGCNSFYIFTETALNQIHSEKINNNIPNFYEDVMSKVNSPKKSFTINKYIRISVAAAAIFIAIWGGNLLGNYNSEALQQGFADVITEDVIEEDLADNNFDLFNNF